LRNRPPLLPLSWLASDRPVVRLIARPLRIFLKTEAAGGVVLLGATMAALIWVNFPVGDSYDQFWGTEVGFSFGDAAVAGDLRHWVTDALMTVFFFVVGLEIKRELVAGELNEIRKAALPAVAALGGMIAPAFIYMALNVGEPSARGWGIPMATDIAFAVGVLALLGARIPSGLRVFLLSLAIVDDIGAILVIAVFYASDLALGWLALAGVLLLAVVLLRRAGVLWVPVYAVVGGAVWFATFQSGVHATLAGVALGLLTPARPTDPGGFKDVIDRAVALPDEPDAETVRAVSLEGQEVVSVAERLEHFLHPWTSYVIIPLFALANAGLILSADSLRNALTSRATLGIIAGLIVGKVVGISGMSWLAIRAGWAELPTGVSHRHLLGVSAIAGIGFTVSLFITGLAFPDSALADGAKMGVLFASILAGVLGAVILLSISPGREEIAAEPGDHV
jgi:NhaA family Na+:H+ antiporter